MSQPVLKAGSSDPCVTGEVRVVADKDSCTVTVEGLYSALKSEDPEDYVPSGYTLSRHTLSPSGGGLGKLSVECIKYESGESLSPSRTTFRIDMEAVTYDLEDHPYLKDVRETVLKWLATDESERASGGSYRYKDENGSLVNVPDGPAKKFCAAYMAGIKTFNRYFPVIEKISTWRNPPGLTISGRSFTGGSPEFSSQIGTYDEPPINLEGFDGGGWFKSKDSWGENENRTWTRTEQWTYTPEASSGDNGWIYTDL